jgi:uncharacterized delta-60 repeat protein
VSLRRVLVLTTATALIVQLGAAARSEGLDTSFGEQGTAIVDLDGADAATTVTNAGGSLLVAGSTCQGPCDAFVSSLLPDGMPDQAFGDGGTARVDLGGSERILEIAHRDEAIVAAGSYCTSSVACDLMILRFDATGRLDPTFGDSGIVLTDLGGTDHAESLVLRRNGTVTVGGSSCAAAEACDMAIARYGSDGTLDPSFNSDGIVVSDVDHEGLNDRARDLDLDSEGRVLVGGSSCTEAGLCNVVAARYLADGRRDRSFGGDGAVVRGFGGHEEAEAVFAAPDGTTYLAGFTCRPGSDCDFLAVGFGRKGGTSDSFGQLGMAVMSFGAMDRAADAILRDDGKLVLVGSTCIENECDVAVGRFGTDGAADYNFGDAGRVVVERPGNEVVSATARDGVSKLAVAGGTGGDVLVSRYLIGRPVLKVRVDAIARSRSNLKGRFFADRRGCVADRRSALHRVGTGVVARPRTDGGGRWSSARAREGARYWATIPRLSFLTPRGMKVVCEAARSNVVER